MHSTSWVQLIYKLLQTHLFYSSFCTALKYAMDHRHADVAAIFLSYRYTKYALAFPKIPVVLGRPYRSGISAVRAVKWGLLQNYVVSFALQFGLSVYVSIFPDCTEEPRYLDMSCRILTTLSLIWALKGLIVAYSALDASHACKGYHLKSKFCL